MLLLSWIVVSSLLTNTASGDEVTDLLDVTRPENKIFGKGFPKIFRNNVSNPGEFRLQKLTLSGI